MFPNGVYTLNEVLRSLSCVRTEQKPSDYRLGRRPHYTGEIWTTGIFLRLRLSSVKKRSFSKTLFQPGKFENSCFSVSCVQKTFWRRSFPTALWLSRDFPDRVFVKHNSRITGVAFFNSLAVHNGWSNWNFIYQKCVLFHHTFHYFIKFFFFIYITHLFILIIYPALFIY